MHASTSPYRKSCSGWISKRVPRWLTAGSDGRSHTHINPTDISAGLPGQPEDGKMLVCFWDMQQRPSRHCLKSLAQKAENLADKGVAVLCVHASEIDEEALKEWMKNYNVPFAAKTINHDAEKTRFAWGVKSLPWLILTDQKHIVEANGFSLAELGEKI